MIPLKEIEEHYTKLFGYTVVNIGVNPDNHMDVRLYMCKQHNTDGKKSYSYIEVAPCTDNTETKQGWLKIEPAQITPTEEKKDE